MRESRRRFPSPAPRQWTVEECLQERVLMGRVHHPPQSPTAACKPLSADRPPREQGKATGARARRPKSERKSLPCASKKWVRGSPRLRGEESSRVGSGRGGGRISNRSIIREKPPPAFRPSTRCLALQKPEKGAGECKDRIRPLTCLRFQQRQRQGKRRVAGP